MTNTPSLSNRTLGVLAAVGGAAWIGSASIMALDRDVRGDVIDTASAHTMIGLMAAALVLTCAGLVLLGRRAGASRAIAVAAGGQLLLAVTMTVSNVRGTDASWFVVAAPVANAMWLLGSIRLAMLLRRAGEGRVLAFGLPAVWLCAIPLSILNLGVFAGAFWLIVALRAVLTTTTDGRPALA